MKRARIEGSEYAQVGIIESISLRNFMCHENLYLRFDPHINFIVGSNGSGKSAIITGIMLALGGKSCLTGRFSNIKGFVQTGKHHAVVAVKIKNCGPNAYKPDVYGEIITFERHITVDNSSLYKIKTEDGKIMSQSKEELNTILNFMDIQIDNPITILTQEISKSFLISKNAKDDKLFELFYKGVGLLKIELDYNKSNQEKEEADSEVNRKASALPEMEKDVKRLKTLLDCSARIVDLRKELMWANVIEMENVRDENKEKYLSLRKKLTNLQQRLASHQDDLSSASEDLAEIESKKKQSEEKLTVLTKEVTEMKIKKSALHGEYMHVKTGYAHSQREFQRLTEDISNLEKMIAENVMRNQNNVNEVKMQHERKLVEIKKSISAIAEEIVRLENEVQSKQETVSRVHKDIDACQAEIQDYKSRIRNVEIEKQQLTDGVKNRISMYGQEMKNVIMDINLSARNGQFKKIPKGPIGLYVNVKDPQWCSTVQECLKVGMLKSFCCDNHKDAEVLGRIIQKHFIASRFKPSIITSKFIDKEFNVENYKTRCAYPTVLDMVEISDPVITNVLIDQKRIENIILIADQNEAINLMLDNPPRNCSSAYTMNGDLILSNPYRFYPCKNRSEICLVKNTDEADINKMNFKLEALNASIMQKVAEKRTLENLLNQNVSSFNSKNSEITQSRIKLRHAEMKLKEEQNSYEEPKDINCLAGDLEQIKNERVSVEQLLTSYRDISATKDQELSDLMKIIKETEQTITFEYGAVRQFADKAEELEKKKETSNATIRDTKAKIKNIEPEVDKNRINYENSIEDTEKATKNALEICPRIETDRDAASLEQLIGETQKALLEQRNLDREGLLCLYSEKFERLNKAKQELQRQERINKKIELMIKKRLGEFQQICRSTAIQLSCHFTTLLRENNFRGRPDINFENKTLHIIAKPNNVKGHDRHQLSQLSGGERSYVMIAFLLSLWDKIHMPFRILDEYDVFMDPNNRHLSINLLINTANTKKNVQYIFLSPLELPPLSNGANVKVHKMAPPKR